MSVSSNPAHTPSKNASSEALSIGKVIQADMPSIASETQVDKGSPCPFFVRQAIAFSLQNDKKHVVVGNESDCVLISFQQPEASANEDIDNNASDHLQITVVKNKEDLLPALAGFLEGAQQTETTQVTSAPSKL
ncbi:hypothetical protein CcaCcLH18_09647 [Colletotrichum camelliae]|nr:hypothetical protein CcaCcLH18_09647 [Colletotrichum camelliae]